MNWNRTQHKAKGSFPPASGFALVHLWWSHAGIEIPYPALFPLAISHPNPIKTRNPAPTSNWNSRFPPLYWAQIPNITATKSQIPHPAKPIGDPHKRFLLFFVEQKVSRGKLSFFAYVISGERSANKPPKISSILQKMKIGQNSIYALFAWSPSILRRRTCNHHMHHL